MGFEKVYQRCRNKEEGRNPKTTILPFFNYQYDSDQDPAIETDWNSGVDLPRWRRLLKNASVQYNDTFTRGETCVDPELEDKFAKMLRTKYRHIWNTPYICLSASEFHFENSGTFWGKILTYAGFACGLPALAGLISRTAWQFWLSVLAGLILIIIGGAKDTKHQETKLSEMSPEYVEKNRQAYLDSMVKAYGQELGQILQQIAISEGRDRK